MRLASLAMFLVGCLGGQHVIDRDGDGISASSDCDDADPAVLGPTVHYVDADGDGLPGASTAYGCDAVAGDPSDCDDDDPSEPRTRWVDADADGWGAEETFGCGEPGLAVQPGDCDDGNP